MLYRGLNCFLFFNLFNCSFPTCLILFSGVGKSSGIVPQIHIREYYKTKEDLLALLLKTPILNNFSEIGISTIDYEK